MACDWFFISAGNLLWHACPFKKQILNIISQLLQSDLFIPQMEKRSLGGPTSESAVGEFIRMIRKFPLENLGNVPFLLTQLCLLLGVASCWRLTATAVFQPQQSVTMWQIIFLVRTTTTVTITTITQTWCLWQIFFWQIAFQSMIKANNIGYGIDHSFGLRSKGAARNWVCV